MSLSLRVSVIGRCIGTVALSCLLSGCATPSLVSRSAPSRRISPGQGRDAAPVLIGSPHAFARGACVAYPPIGKDLHRTVFVDPGHGGPDPGTTATAPSGALLTEKGLSLQVARDLLAKLRQAGYRVILSRTINGPVARLQPSSMSDGGYTPKGVKADLQARADCANLAHAQILLSIHFDAFDDPTVGGAQTDYDPDRPFSRQSLHFATLVQQAIIHAFAAHGWSVLDRGVLADTQLSTYVLSAQGASYGHLLELGPADPGWFNRPSQMPGALTEPLFISDPEEASIAASRAGQEALAGALAQAIWAYFSCEQSEGRRLHP